MRVIAKDIIEIRKSNELTQEKFAKELGYSRSYVKDIESGRSKPSRRFLEAITKKFGISLDSLIENNVGQRIYNSLKINDFKNCFAFVYGFTLKERLAAEKELLEYLDDKDHVIVDASNISSHISFLNSIIDKKANASTIQAELDSFCLEKEHLYILVKNFSQSKIPQKGHTLREMAKLHEWASTPFEYVFIVLDKPSLLEKYQDDLYYYAFTIHYKARGKSI